MFIAHYLWLVFEEKEPMNIVGSLEYRVKEDDKHHDMLMVLLSRRSI
jgi:hypothetical protein